MLESYKLCLKMSKYVCTTQTQNELVRIKYWAPLHPEKNMVHANSTLISINHLGGVGL